MSDGHGIALVRIQITMNLPQEEITVTNDWTKNWQASIAVKITAVTLWPTIFITFLAAHLFLADLEQDYIAEHEDVAIHIAYHVTNLWPNDQTLSFLEKLEELRTRYRALDLPGFELSKQGKIYIIGDLSIHESYIDLPLQIHSEPGLEIRAFFPDAAKQATELRNEVIAVIFVALVLFGIFLSVSTHIILDKPFQALIETAQKIIQGHQNIRIDTQRKDEFGTIARFFNKMVDSLTEQKSLEQAAKTDFLTGIANRRHFDEVLSYELRRNARTNNALTLIMCDVDYFKQYNDSYNHVAGDLCLKHIARTLSNVFNRASDLVARFGGEEFVVILPDTDRETGIKMAEMLRQEVKNLQIPHAHSGVSNYVTVSVGVASIHAGKKPSAAELLQAVDTALYKAKQNGRDRVEVYDETISAA
jgi:diguanylate cyclase (GGDEF)-like protein